MRVTIRVAEVASAPAYQASTRVRNIPKATMATTMPVAVSPLRNRWRRMLRRINLIKNTMGQHRGLASGRLCAHRYAVYDVVDAEHVPGVGFHHVPLAFAGKQTIKRDHPIAGADAYL